MTMTKRSQINVRSTAAIDAVLQSLVDATGRNKTAVVHAALLSFAETNLTPEQLLQCLKKDV